MKHILTIIAFVIILFIASWFVNAKNVVTLPSTVKDMIKVHASFYGVSEKLVLDLAMIESSMCTNTISKASSARGCFQFIESTWNNYCTGDAMNENDNIRCAIKLISNGGLKHWTADKHTKDKLIALGYKL